MLSIGGALLLGGERGVFPGPFLLPPSFFELSGVEGAISGDKLVLRLGFGVLWLLLIPPDGPPGPGRAV